MIISIEEVLRYLFDFLIIFFICFAGSLSRDVYESVKNGSKIKLKLNIISTIFSSAVLKVVLKMASFRDIEFLVLICFFVGLWSFHLLSMAVNHDVMKVILKAMLRGSKSAAAKILVESISDLEDEEKKKKGIENNSSSEKEEKKKT